MKKKRVAINGFGRIGRLAFKIMRERADLEVVAINDLSDNNTLGHLLKYDTAYKTYKYDVSATDTHIKVGKKSVHAFSERDPKKLPWKKLKIDIVLEATGIFRDKKTAGMHISAGAKRVVISAPSKGDGIDGFVRGVNCHTYQGQTIIDNASCTTNCTAPVVTVLESVFGIEKAMLTTIHSYTAGQNLQDGSHKDLRRARAAAQNIVPTTTGAAKATTKIIPQLKGKFDGIAVRVPTITVSLTDFTFLLSKDVTIEKVNKALIKASKGPMKGILGVSNVPLVSSDFIGDDRSSIVDLEMTRVVDGNLVKVVAWYDNEWGYANRLVELTQIVGRQM